MDFKVISMVVVGMVETLVVVGRVVAMTMSCGGGGGIVAGVGGV